MQSNDTLLLGGKAAIVTGASSGIGRAIALAYARAGAGVIVSDLNVEGGNETVKLIRDTSGKARFVPADVSKPDDSRRLVEACVEEFGRLDIACNNAGIAGDLFPTADYPVETWDRLIAINLSGVFYGMKYQIGQMLKNGGGAIVNIASILGTVGFANAPAYTAAKHGVIGLTKTAALEYSSQGVRVNSVGPAFIHTPMISALESDVAMRQALVDMHPIGRLGTAEEVAALVLFLSSPQASFITGSYHPVDGGFLAR